MPKLGNRTRASLLVAGLIVAAPPALAQAITALPDQTASIRLSNRDVNHIICQGGEIEDVKFSAEKAIAVERGGSDAWIKFLVKEVDGEGAPTRTYVTTPSEFFVSCNGAIYPLYTEPSDIPAQTVILASGTAQRARANQDLLGPLVEEERAVSITLSMLQDRVPASFAEVAPGAGDIVLPTLPAARLHERRRFTVEGAGLSASEYLVQASADQVLAEPQFLVSMLGSNIFAVTLDRIALKAGDSARLIIIRRGDVQ
ncbi:type-F conjugative transfer system secretin TraK [Sphingomonas oligophenolica]|uniref:Type-F conjugative transfer system secretin TraK n=1 Tax=Sphingomonas oligophenolica TaxID=301154 RepID=A0ABU9Y363_9SPHN